MINITDLFGREGMAGFAVYLLAAYGLSGPIAERHADRHLVPRCQAGEQALARTPKLKSLEDTARDATAAMLEREGGPVGQALAGIIKFKSTMEKQQAAANAAAGAATCACRIRHAMLKTDVRWSWTVYVASWRLLEDAPGQTLAAAAMMNSDGLCTGGAS